MSAASAALGAATSKRTTMAPATIGDCRLAEVAVREDSRGKAGRRRPEQFANLAFSSTRQVTGSTDLRAALREQLFQQ